MTTAVGSICASRRESTVELALAILEAGDVGRGHGGRRIHTRARTKGAFAHCYFADASSSIGSAPPLGTTPLVDAGTGRSGCSRARLLNRRTDAALSRARLTPMLLARRGQSWSRWRVGDERHSEWPNGGAPGRRRRRRDSQDVCLAASRIDWPLTSRRTSEMARAGHSQTRPTGPGGGNGEIQ